LEGCAVHFDLINLRLLAVVVEERGITAGAPRSSRDLARKFAHGNLLRSQAHRMSALFRMSP
jgi:hypothetical protein